MLLYYPQQISIGPGSIRDIPAFANNKGLKKALIVTDANLAQGRILPLLQSVLKGAGIDFAVFNQVVSNPYPELCDYCAAAFKKENCDFLIGFGGGSAIDTAKAASLVIANGGSIRNYIGVNRSVHKGVPVVAVATTAGTGAEATCFFVLTEKDGASKSVTLDDNCLADLAVSDPELMLSLPWDVTASTALDAVTHAMEAYCSVAANPFSDGLALKAVSLIYHALPLVMRNPENIEARTDLCWGAALAGYAFSNSSLGLMHSLGFSIENFVHIPHGQAVAIAMPYVLDYNRRVVGDRIGNLGKAMGLSDEVTLGAKTVHTMKAFISGMGIPSLADTGFDSQNISALADMALADPTLPGNPVQPSKEELIALIEDIYCNS